VPGKGIAFFSFGKGICGVLRKYSEHYSQRLRLSTEGVKVKMRRVWFGISILLLMIAACAPTPPAATEEPSYPSPSEPSYPGEQPADLTTAEIAVVKQLAANLGLQESDISVVRSEVVEFGDSCLGITMEGVMCAQVVTPGRIIMLEADGIQYEYHTSENGDRIQPATQALVWKREGGIAGFCDILTVFRSGEVYTTSCNAQAEGKMGTVAELLASQERQQFRDWIAAFTETRLDASDPEGVADRMVVTLEFFGVGGQSPTESEQQDLFNFAQELYQELSTK
jgi:hypothetical protein